MKQGFLLPAITLSLLASSIYAETAEQSAKMKVLDRWLGTWNSHVVLKSSLWIPEGKQQKEIKTADWTLGGQFQQVSISSNTHESREIQRYDKGARSIRNGFSIPMKTQANGLESGIQWPQP